VAGFEVTGDTNQFSTYVHATPAISSEDLLGVTTLKLLTRKLHQSSPNFTYVHLTSPKHCAKMCLQILSNLTSLSANVIIEQGI
jgi:hypothetical protein